VATRHGHGLALRLSAGVRCTISVTISRAEHEAAVLPPFPIQQPLLALTTRSMSQTHPNASSSSNYRSVLNAALDAYEKKTKSKLLTHPLAAQLQSCDSPTAILSILQDLIQQFDHRRRSDERLTNWLNPTVNVLYAFSSTIGQGVGLVSTNRLSTWNLCSNRDSSGILTHKRDFFWHRGPSYGEHNPRSLCTGYNDTGI
jgi:hypothetical protein